MTEEKKCPLYKKCGGCQLQNLSYAEQLKFKQRKVEKLLGRLTPQQAQMFSDIISDPKRLEATLASPQVTAMLKKVLGGK